MGATKSRVGGRRYQQVSAAPNQVVGASCSGTLPTTVRRRYPQSSLARVVSGPYMANSVGSAAVVTLAIVGARLVNRGAFGTVTVFGV